MQVKYREQLNGTRRESNLACTLRSSRQVVCLLQGHDILGLSSKLVTLDIDLSDIVVCRECGCVYSVRSANNPNQCPVCKSVIAIPLPLANER
jgi:rubrerythrin